MVEYSQVQAKDQTLFNVVVLCTYQWIKDQFLKEQKGDIHSETLIDIETSMWENSKKLVIY